MPQKLIADKDHPRRIDMTAEQAGWIIGWSNSLKKQAAVTAAVISAKFDIEVHAKVGGRDGRFLFLTLFGPDIGLASDVAEFAKSVTHDGELHYDEVQVNIRNLSLK